MFETNFSEYILITELYEHDLVKAAVLTYFRLKLSPFPKSVGTKCSQLPLCRTPPLPPLVPPRILATEFKLDLAKTSPSALMDLGMVSSRALSTSGTFTNLTREPNFSAKLKISSEKTPKILHLCQKLNEMMGGGCCCHLPRPLLQLTN